MSTQFSDQDLLPHIDAGQDKVSATETLEDRAAFTAMCVNIISFAGSTLKVCLDLAGGCVDVNAVLSTPLGDLKLGSGRLCPDRPCIKLGSGAFGFKAEIETCLSTSPLGIRIKATVCAPRLGCRSVERFIPLTFAGEAASKGACSGCGG